MAPFILLRASWVSVAVEKSCAIIDAVRVERSPKAFDSMRETAASESARCQSR